MERIRAAKAAAFNAKAKANANAKAKAIDKEFWALSFHSVKYFYSLMKLSDTVVNACF